MDRVALLSKLSIRLSHLAEPGNVELAKELETLRHSLRDGMDEGTLERVSERLARHMLLNETSPAAPKPKRSEFAAEFARNIKELELEKSQRSQLAKLADQLIASDQIETQLKTLNEVFKLLKTATKPAPAKKASSGGLLGWLDKKGPAENPHMEAFLEKSSRLIDQAIKHIDILNGNTKDTRGLKDAVKNSADVESLGKALDEVISLLKEHGVRIEEERATTQSFLGDLRKRLSNVEESIFSVITDGDESLERAVVLEQQVGDDVRAIGQAVEVDDLSLLKKTVEGGLNKLSSTVTDYLTVEKDKHQESKKKVEDLNRKIKDMEEQARDLRGQIKDKQDLAVKDALTGVYNRAGYEQRIGEELARSQRSGSPLSLVFVDCNKFKQINDTYGHAAGDVVLVQVAGALSARARASDIIARYGGDEFVAVLPDTPAEGAEHFARDTCQRILNAGFNANGQPLDVSISCGITQARKEDTPESAIKRADEAMYLAKKAEGHKVVVV